MIAYPDTSFLCALYRDQENSDEAAVHRESMTEPLCVTELLEFEFLQSLRLQSWLHAHDRKRGFPPVEAEEIVADWEQDVATGVVMVVSCDDSAVLRQGASLSRRFTADGGHRTLDVLHVATAVHLGAKEFLSFDARQKRLAHHAGLKTPL